LEGFCFKLFIKESLDFPKNDTELIKTIEQEDKNLIEPKPNKVWEICTNTRVNKLITHLKRKKK